MKMTAFSGTQRGTILLAGAALLLAACGDKGVPGFGGGDDKPTGQVVARLNGEDITTLEVNAELAGTPIPPTMNRRDAEKMALQNIITRRMLKGAAQERELDKTPQFLLQQRRTEEQLHVQALAREIASKVQPPASDEIDNFMNQNPTLFRERKFFILDQIQFLRPANIEKLGLESAKTMEAVEGVLSAGNIEFRRQPASLDALGANPAFISEVNKVLERNPQELFMFANQPQGAPAPVMLINQVKETRVLPFTGERARQFATSYLQNQRIQAALAAEVKKQQAAAKEAAVFQEGWEPAVVKPGTAKALAGATPRGPGVPGSNTPNANGGQITTAPPPPPAPAIAPEPAPAPAG